MKNNWGQKVSPADYRLLISLELEMSGYSCIKLKNKTLLFIQPINIVNSKQNVFTVKFSYIIINMNFICEATLYAPLCVCVCVSVHCIVCSPNMHFAPNKGVPFCLKFIKSPCPTYM